MSKYNDLKRKLLSEFSKLVGEPTLAERSGQTRKELYHIEEIDEVLKEILQISQRTHDMVDLREDPVLNLTHELLNRFLLYINKAPVSKSFYDYFFHNSRERREADTLVKFQSCVDYFRRVAMLKYGSFKRAWVELSRNGNIEESLWDLKHVQVEDIAAKAIKISLDEINDEELFMLGYLTGENPETLYDQSIKLLARSITTTNGKKSSEIIDWDNDDINDLCELIQNHTNENIEALFNENNINKLKGCLSIIKERRKVCKIRQEIARKIGSANTNRYLTAKKIDVYFATSMRGIMDFKNMHKFVGEVMNDPSVARLNLNYFDPTMCYTTNHRVKGLVECLMLKRANVTIYMAGETDSFGKDSELATTLVQGKPGIVYVPEGNDENRDKLNERYELFTKHPLAMQVDLKTGVAHGVLVTRRSEVVARLLYEIFTNRLDFDIADGLPDGENYLLIEKRTKCAYRIVSKDLLLTNCFWNFYFEREEKKPNLLVRLGKELPNVIQ